MIFETDVDRSHPLAAGIPRDRLPVFRAQADVYRLEGDPLRHSRRLHTSAPVISGYVSDENAKRIAGSAAMTAERVGN